MTPSPPYAKADTVSGPYTVTVGLSGAISQEGHLSLRVYASDADQDERLYLTCRAERQGGAGVGVGRFDSDGEVPMRYDRSAASWIGSIEWRPDSQVLAGDQFLLTAEIRDRAGATVTASGSGLVRLEVVPQERIVFRWLDDIWTVMPDGTGLKRLTSHPAMDDFPDLSPDGSLIVFCCDRNGGDRDLFLMGSDGGFLRQLTNLGGNERSARFTPYGRQIVYLHEFNSIRAIGVDGTNDRVILPGNWEDVAISPNGEWVATCHDNFDDALLFRLDPPGADFHPLNLSSKPDDPEWHPTATSPAIFLWNANNGNKEVRSIDMDLASGTTMGAERVLLSGAQDPSISPDGQRFIYVNLSTQDLWISSLDGTIQQS